MDAREQVGDAMAVMTLCTIVCGFIAPLTGEPVTGKPVRRVSEGAVRKRTCTWQAPRRAAYPTNGLKQWRGLSTRTDKPAIAYQAALHLAGILIRTRR